MTDTPDNCRALWSPDDVARLDRMMSQKIDPSEIAAQLGRTESAIETKFRALQAQRLEYRARKHRRHNGASFFLS